MTLLAVELVPEVVRRIYVVVQVWLRRSQLRRLSRCRRDLRSQSRSRRLEPFSAVSKQRPMGMLVSCAMMLLPVNAQCIAMCDMAFLRPALPDIPGY